jgi:hypothetical protein
MKLSIFNLSLFFILSFNTANFASTLNEINENPTTKVEIKGSESEKSLIVEFSNQKEEDATISILDENGAVIHIDKAKNTIAYTKKFNLLKLEKGKYTLKIVRESTKTIQFFEVTKKGIVINNNERKDITAPSVKQEDSKFDVVISSITNKMSVKVLDQNGEVIFEDAQKGITTLNKRYNLSNITKGEYLIQVTVDGETYYHNFVK